MIVDFIIDSSRRSMFKKVSKPVLIALAIVAGVILVAAIIFGILYSIEWHSKNFNQTQKCMYY